MTAVIPSCLPAARSGIHENDLLGYKRQWVCSMSSVGAMPCCQQARSDTFGASTRCESAQMRQKVLTRLTLTYSIGMSALNNAHMRGSLCDIGEQ
jgi:hypothetical protein